MSKNNNITIGVKITTPPVMIAHSDDHRRNIWEMRAERERMSGNATDYFTIRFPESAYPSWSADNKINPKLREVKAGDIVELVGEICSNDSLNRKERFAHIYADQIEFADTVEKNSVQLCGRVCTKINTYENPRNNRKYAAFKVSVKSKGSRHYISIAASGEPAAAIEKIGVGELVEIRGLLQYREYTKLNDGVMHVRGIYEVSAKTIVTMDLKENGEDNHNR